jgi:hypothetical protein
MVNTIATPLSSLRTSLQKERPRALCGLAKSLVVVWSVRIMMLPLRKIGELEPSCCIQLTYQNPRIE